MASVDTLVTEGAVLYLDNNILDRDSNEPFWRINGEGSRTVKRFELAVHLGAATRFHDLKDSILRRQQIYSGRLYETIRSGRGHIRTIFPILEEHDAYIRHLETACEYLKRRSVGQKRRTREIMLRDIIESHRNISRELASSAYPIQEKDLASQVCSYLRRFKLHKSQDGHFVKQWQLVYEETSENDALLVAAAIVDSTSVSEGKTVIVSGDCDVINLARNFERIRKVKRLPNYLQNALPNTQIEVCTPSRDSWIPDFGLTLRYSSGPGPALPANAQPS